MVKFSHSEYSFQPKVFSVNGVSMSYLDEGTGPVILMLHGNPTWSFFYRNVVKRLSGKFRCIVPDHIGCGLSDKPQKYPYTLKTHIENVQKLLKHLNIDTFSVIAHDWGGAIGMGVATSAPEKVEKIVLMNTGAFRSAMIPLRIAVCRIPVIGEFLVRGFNAFAASARYMATTQKGGLSDHIYSGFIFPYQNYRDRVAVYNFVKDIPLSPCDTSYETIKKIEKNLEKLKHKKILLLWGMRDFCFNEHFLRIWQYYFPDAQCLEHSGAGHYLLEDEPESINDIERFFSA